MYVCVCGDAEVSYRNWGDCSYVGTVYVVANAEVSNRNWGDGYVN